MLVCAGHVDAPSQSSSGRNPGRLRVPLRRHELIHLDGARADAGGDDEKEVNHEEFKGDKKEREPIRKDESMRVG